MKQAFRFQIGAAAAVTVAGIIGAQGQAIITNGTVGVGVNPEGHLNVDSRALFPPDGLPSAAGNVFFGVRFNATDGEATANGCLCEGWGAKDAISGVTGYANVSVDADLLHPNGVQNLTPLSFVADATTAVSTVRINDALGAGVFEVTHDYHPSSVPELYQVDVKVTNVSAVATELRYRRVFDFDTDPTAFDEFMTIKGAVVAANVLAAHTDGFQTAQPGAVYSPVIDPAFLVDAKAADITDVGSSDIGAMFDFGFGELDPGEMVTFKTYYGAAATEFAALTALAAVGAEVYALGQPNTPDGPTLGTPNTFIFAFGDVGGVVVPHPGVPEPGTWLAGALVCLGAGVRALRRKMS